MPVAAFGLALALGGAYIADPAFQLKALLLAAGLVNVLAFRRAMAKRKDGAPSIAMRLSAISSMVIWISAIFAGRWIAFTY
ncbi:DUF6644 family protein [Sinorhizobium meliloti]|uniref:DUF6644 family protein n=1 Tax=Rhizobium meliloti TaxID=382 RepID=UPI003F5CE737